MINIVWDFGYRVLVEGYFFIYIRVDNLGVLDDFFWYIKLGFL